MTGHNAASSLISIVGVDGCGKTTLLELVRQRLVAQGLRVEVVWSRFNNYLSKPLLALTRLTGHNRRLKIDGVPFGYHDFERLPVYRELFAFTQMVDVNLAAFMRIRPALLRPNDVVILERGPWDTLVDVMADTGLESLASAAFGRWIVRSIANRGKTVLIRRPVDKIMASRPELMHDRKLVLRSGYYDSLASRHKWQVVNNDSTLESAANLLYQAIRAG